MCEKGVRFKGPVQKQIQKNPGKWEGEKKAERPRKVKVEEFLVRRRITEEIMTSDES